MTPARGKCFVKRVETPETLPQGRILLTQDTREAMTAQQVELVAIGAPAYCTDEDCERPHEWQRGPELTHLGDGLLAPDQWALLAPRALNPTDTDGLYIVHQDDVLAILQP